MGDHPGVVSLSFRGNMAENWKLWKARLENYLVVSEVNKKDEKPQVALLLRYIGDEGFQIFTSFKLDDGDRDKLAPVLRKFAKHFLGNENWHTSSEVKLYVLSTNRLKQNEVNAQPGNQKPLKATTYLRIVGDVMGMFVVPLLDGLLMLIGPYEGCGRSHLSRIATEVFGVLVTARRMADEAFYWSGSHAVQWRRVDIHACHQKIVWSSKQNIVYSNVIEL
nr:unnamed protein product [Callosobruchus analis]